MVLLFKKAGNPNQYLIFSNANDGILFDLASSKRTTAIASV